MKFIKYGLIAILCASSAHAQSVVRNDNASTTIQSNNLGNSQISTDLKGRAYTDPTRAGTYTQTNPSISNATSATLLAANSSRKSVIIQNNVGSNICISLNNATLTGIVPSSTNLCIVIPTGGSYTSPPNFTNTSAITVYQTSGSATTAISVLEGV